MGQSVAVVHCTQVPEIEHLGVGGMHMGAQALPPEPQAIGVSPGWQVPPLQHPPLQSDDGLQLVVHTPPLHA